MHCTKCSKALPEGATHCPYCGAEVAIVGAAPNEGIALNQAPPATAERKTFCVKCGAELHPQAGFCTKCGTTRSNVNFQQQQPMMPPQPHGHMHGQLVCPRCGSTNVLKAKTAQWALIAAIIGFFLVCVLSLFFLMVKDPNRCLNCGYQF
jgi:ribosomal protein L40E